jgi:hypothetical protein
MSLRDHLTNAIAHYAQKSGHKTIAGIVDAANATSKNRHVRQCAQDRRAKRSGEPTIRIIHQRGE